MAQHHRTRATMPRKPRWLQACADRTDQRRSHHSVLAPAVLDLPLLVWHLQLCQSDEALVSLIPPPPNPPKALHGLSLTAPSPKKEGTRTVTNQTLSTLCRGKTASQHRPSGAASFLKNLTFLLDKDVLKMVSRLGSCSDAGSQD